MGDDLSSVDKFKDLLSQTLKKDKKETLKTITESNLCGRGGAGFPTGMKWNFCSQQKVEKKYVVCNADEGDSGAFSDRYLLEDQPLKVLFGMIACAYIIGSDEGVLYIRGEYPKSIEIINGTINELKKLNLLGENILGTDFSCDLSICIGQGAYICGEETALIASIEGRRAEVDVRPPFPVTEGLYKKPTVVNNVETLAAAAGILLNGAEKFVPKIFSPNKPSFFKELIDAFKDSIDFGYSPLIYKTPSSLPITCPQITIPNITFKAWSSSKYLSEYAPESPSSALQITYFFSPFALRQKSHFTPVGKPAPPRPVKLESNNNLIISCFSIVINFFK